jgi:hypothetical protein
MARLKRPPTLDPGPNKSVESVSLTFPLEVLLDGPRPGRNDPEADRAWLEQRAYVHRLCASNPQFDPRQVIDLDLAGIARWRADRLAWLQREVGTVADEETDVIDKLNVGGETWEK